MKLSRALRGDLFDIKPWHRRNFTDPKAYAKYAEELGFRSENAFKLIQIQRRFRMLSTKRRVVELGAAPGAWTQVLITCCGPRAQIVSCDLLPIDHLDGVVLMPGVDFTKTETVEAIRKHFMTRYDEDKPNLDLVLSDMAPKRIECNVDHEAIVRLVMVAIKFAIENSRVGADFIGKLWDGPEKLNIVRNVERFYSKVELFTPQSSKNDPGEVFLIAKRFKGIKKPK